MDFNFQLSAFSCLLLSLLLTPQTEADGDPPARNRIEIPQRSAVVQIDGYLHESVWQDAAMLVLVDNDSAKPGREQTEIRLWYDGSAIYIGWICQDLDIQATFTERDSRFWEEEVAEFFVTQKDLANYYELQWNPLGGVFDAVIQNDLDESGLSKGIEGDWDFTATGMTSAVTVQGTVADSRDKDVRWQVEVRVPFSDLGTAAPEVGDVWRANFYRFNRGAKHEPEKLAWSPTRLPSFHQPNRFGFLVFGE